MVLFQGFASNISNKKVYDIDLVKQDLLNRIYTRKGERLMNPNFGSIIWDLLFEHQSEFVVNEIRRDLQEIIESDPRVQLQQLDVQAIEHGYLAVISLFYVQFNVVDQLRIEFNKTISETPQVN